MDGSERFKTIGTYLTNENTLAAAQQNVAVQELEVLHFIKCWTNITSSQCHTNTSFTVDVSRVQPLRQLWSSHLKLACMSSVIQLLLNTLSSKSRQNFILTCIIRIGERNLFSQYQNRQNYQYIVHIERFWTVFGKLASLRIGGQRWEFLPHDIPPSAYSASVDELSQFSL